MCSYRLTRVAILVSAAIPLGLIAQPSAQQVRTVPAAGGEPQIYVEVFVQGPDGKPILDLKPREIAIRVNGRQRDVRSLQLVRFDAPSAPIQGGPPPFVTNSAAAERDILILLDNESFALDRESTIKEGIGQLLDSVSDRDRVGLATLPMLAVRIAPTRDHKKIEGAVREILARGNRVESDADATCRTKATLELLKALVGSVRSERLTTLVFFSGGIVPPLSMDPLRRSAGPAGACELRTDDLLALEQALERAPVDLHVAHVADSGGSAGTAASMSMATAGVEHLAGIGGNMLIRLRGSSRAAMERLVDETSAYYVVGFSRTPDDDLRVPPRVEAKVSRVNATARSKRSIAVSAVKPHQAGLSVTDMLKDTSRYADLPLRMTALAAPDQDPGKVVVVVMFEPTEPDVRVTSAAVGLFDDTGKLAAQGKAPTADLARAPFILALRANPGSYRVRVTAIDEGGRLGAVDDEMSAGLLKAGSLVFSPLMLGVNHDGRFSPVMQFGHESKAVAYVEVLGVAADANVSAECQVSPPPGSLALPAIPGTVRRGATAQHRIVSCEIPLAGLPAGDATVRAFVTVDGKSTSVTRTLRKTGD